MHALIPTAEAQSITVGLLTGGSDRPYVYGLATALTAKGVTIDLVGSDELDLPEIRGIPGVNFLNLRGDTSARAPFLRKVIRILRYYARLMAYAAKAKPRVFHILWNNKFDTFDRTLLMVYYLLLGKRIALTAHNVNSGRRDHNDTLLNRLTLRIQYGLAEHLFVHTATMKDELVKQFGVPGSKVSVIPLGINNFAPKTPLSSSDAKRRLGICESERSILFFGRITPYKGLEYLVSAYRRLLAQGNNCRLIIAGWVNCRESYWRSIREDLRPDVEKGRVLLRAEFISEDETEVYFKAADVLVLPYRHIYQSGVLSLGYSFGLPALVADVGSLKDEIVEGETGFVFRPEDSADLTRALERYFASDLYANLCTRRQAIKDYAAARHSWDVVSHMTLRVYSGLIQRDGEQPSPRRIARRTDLL